MASDSAPSTAEYVIDTSGSSVLIVAPVVGLTGEATASSGGPPSHTSAHSAPVVSVRSSSGRGQDSPQAAAIHDAISVQSSHFSSAHGQSSSDDEETAQARMDAALAAQEVANQRLARVRAKKRSSRSSRASSIAGAMSPPPGLLGSPPSVREPIPALLLPEEVPRHRHDAHYAPRGAPGSSNLVHTELPIREPTRTGPLQMLSSMFVGGDRRSTETTRPVEHQPLQWHDTELDAANQQAALADFGIIKDKLDKYESERREMAQKVDLFNTGMPLRKSNSSYGTPEDLIDLVPPMEVTQKKKPQVFSMTPRPLHPDTVNDEWEMHTEGLTEKEVNLRCFKLSDRNLELQRRREPDRPPKKVDRDYDGMNERARDQPSFPQGARDEQQDCQARASGFVPAVFVIVILRRLGHPFGL